MWSQAAVELWSAYAPNFKELDENEEYEEKEGEFDIVSECRPSHFRICQFPFHTFKEHFLLLCGIVL